MDVLSMWTVYDHPKDFPHNFVARRQEIHAGKVVQTSEMMICPDLSALREVLAQRGLTPIARSLQDDPVIVEVWL